MNKMADTVIKNMDEKQNDEDKKIMRYEMENEKLSHKRAQNFSWENYSEQGIRHGVKSLLGKIIFVEYLKQF